MTGREKKLILAVRQRIYDLDRTVYPSDLDTNDIEAKSKYQAEHITLKFTDSEILAEIIYGISSYNTDYTIETLPEDKEFIAVTRAVISCLRALAMREARNYKISVDGISISKDIRVTNYLKIADQLEKSLNDTLTSGGFAEIEVKDTKRYNVRTNTLS